VPQDYVFDPTWPYLVDLRGMGLSEVIARIMIPANRKGPYRIETWDAKLKDWFIAEAGDVRWVAQSPPANILDLKRQGVPEADWGTTGAIQWAAGPFRP
jgi:hypothetical protein